MAKGSNSKMTLEEFVNKCIDHVQATTPYKGIHVIYGGLNEAIERAFGNGIKAQAALQELVNKGKFVAVMRRGGPVIYKPKDAPAQRNKATELLKAVGIK